MSQDVLFMMVAGAVGSLAMIAVIVHSYLKHLDRRSLPPDDRLDQIVQQIATLQRAVDATSLEVERLGEGQRFAAKLLAERDRVRERPGQPERVITPH